MSLIPFRTRRPAALEPAGLSTLSEFRHEMNRMFDGLFTRPLSIPPWFEAAEPGQWLPAVDMSEDPQRILIRAELPGIDPKQVNVDVTEDRLVISGSVVGCGFTIESKDCANEGDESVLPTRTQ